MEQTELEAQVFNALCNDSDLLLELADGAGSIFHIVAPADDLLRYPCLVYSVTLDNPEIHGDNAELYHYVDIRIHIVTTDGEYAVIDRRVKYILLGLGFMRRNVTPYLEDGLKVLICDYRILIPA